MMTTFARSRYAGHRFPPEVIGHAVWLYFRFPLSPRMVEERWSPIVGQLGGWDKLGSGFGYAAKPMPSEMPAWTSAGVLPPRAEWGRRLRAAWGRWQL